MRATNVEKVVKSYGLTCTLNWNECMTTVAPTKASRDSTIFDRGYSALMAVAVSMPTKMVEPIM